MMKHSYLTIGLGIWWWYSRDFAIWWQNGIHLTEDIYVSIVIHFNGDVKKYNRMTNIELVTFNYFRRLLCNQISYAEGGNETYFTKNHAEQGFSISYWIFLIGDLSQNHLVDRQEYPANVKARMQIFITPLMFPVHDSMDSSCIHTSPRLLAKTR